VLLRADSAFYAQAVVHAAAVAGAQVSITLRQDQRVKAAIAAIDEHSWTPIQYTDAIFDEQTQAWTSRAEVAEIPYTAFTSHAKAQQVPGRLVVRRIPDLAPKKSDGQPTLFDLWRFHAFFTTTPPEQADTVTADKTHRHHAIIESVHADVKHAALAHLPEVISSWSRRRGCELGGCVVDGVVDAVGLVGGHEQVTWEILFVGVSRRGEWPVMSAARFCPSARSKDALINGAFWRSGRRRVDQGFAERFDASIPSCGPGFGALQPLSGRLPPGRHPTRVTARARINQFADANTMCR
jgi:hypothetical protein